MPRHAIEEWDRCDGQYRADEEVLKVRSGERPSEVTERSRDDVSARRLSARLRDRGDHQLRRRAMPFGGKSEEEKQAKAALKD
jgi:hypothetical protein